MKGSIFFKIFTVPNMFICHLFADFDPGIWNLEIYQSTIENWLVVGDMVFRFSDVLERDSEFYRIKAQVLRLSIEYHNRWFDINRIYLPEQVGNFIQILELPAYKILCLYLILEKQIAFSSNVGPFAWYQHYWLIGHIIIKHLPLAEILAQTDADPDLWFQLIDQREETQVYVTTLISRIDPYLLIETLEVMEGALKTRNLRLVFDSKYGVCISV